MSLVDTEVQCPYCKNANIVAIVESKTDTPMMDIPLGPGSKCHYYLVVTSFHCSNQKCALKYEFPPGRPNAAEEILSKIHENEEASIFNEAFNNALKDIKKRVAQAIKK